MTKSLRTPYIAWARLVLGFVLFLAMGSVWAFIREFDEWLFIFPAGLMGVDPRDLMSLRKKKENSE